jgi:hypothetical protein
LLLAEVAEVLPQVLKLVEAEVPVDIFTHQDIL